MKRVCYSMHLPTSGKSVKALRVRQQTDDTRPLFVLVDLCNDSMCGEIFIRRYSQSNDRHTIVTGRETRVAASSLSSVCALAWQLWQWCLCCGWCTKLENVSAGRVKGRMLRQILMNLMMKLCSWHKMRPFTQGFGCNTHVTLGTFV